MNAEKASVQSTAVREGELVRAECLMLFPAPAAHVAVVIGSSYCIRSNHSFVVG